MMPKLMSTLATMEVGAMVLKLLIHVSMMAPGRIKSTYSFVENESATWGCRGRGAYGQRTEKQVAIPTVLHACRPPAAQGTSLRWLAIKRR